MSLPIPAHFVLMTTRQSLRYVNIEENKLFNPTQFSGPSSPSPSPPWCCRHWASQCARGLVLAGPAASPCLLPKQLVIKNRLAGLDSLSFLTIKSRLPIMSAVSFLSTKIWTFMLAAWSARRGSRNARSLSMFLQEWNANLIPEDLPPVAHYPILMSYVTKRYHTCASSTAM